MPRFGDVYNDQDSSAHMRYGVSPNTCAVFVIRPEGIYTDLEDTALGFHMLRELQ